MNEKTDRLEKGTPDWRRRRTICLAVLVCAGAVWGGLELLLYGHKVAGLVTVLMTIAIAVTIMLWCVCDGHLKGVAPSYRLRLLIVLLGIVGVPIHFHRSRSKQEFFRAAFGFGLYVAALVPYYLSWYVLRYLLVVLNRYA